MECYKKDYPRPQLVRDNWTSLNGMWDFCFDDEERGERGSWYQMWPGNQAQTIEVPFTYETKRSGIGDERAHRQIWYRRSIEADAAQLSEKHLWLHFEGSDFHTKVWVNGQYVGDHRGGYARFSFDITRFVKAKENEIVVKVEDSFDPGRRPARQTALGEGQLWLLVCADDRYLEDSLAGICPEIYLNQVKMTPLLTDSSLELTYDVVLPEEQRDGSVEIEAEITFDGIQISRTRMAVLGRSVKTRANVFHPALGGMEWGVREWTPEDPALYDIRFRVLVNGEETDCAGSYFAMREIRIDGPNILLNGKVLYQRLILGSGLLEGYASDPSVRGGAGR